MAGAERARKRRRLVPEVVQTSMMDCGPASLKALLEGFGISVSYGRLREACQTSVDGTSIDTLEEVAGQLGLDVEQTLLPIDHLLLEEAEALPALVVVRLPDTSTHFVVVWSRVGPFVQVMDPAKGRRWVREERFLEEVYVHRMDFPAEAFREFGGSEPFLRALGRRLEDLGMGRAEREAAVARALADPSWRGVATLDAAARTTAAIVAGGGLRRGKEAAGATRLLVDKALEDPGTIPPSFWTARAPATSAPTEGEESVRIAGAVMLRVKGAGTRATEAGEDGDPAARPVSEELARALAEPPARPGLELFRMLKRDGQILPAGLLLALAAAAAMVALEALILGALVQLAATLSLFEQRAAGLAALFALALVLLFLEVSVASALLGMGRRLEVRFRMALLAKLPKLEDRYLASRPVSDMAERSHTMHLVRQLPWAGGQLARAVFGLVATCAAIGLFDPPSAIMAAAAAAVAIAVPLLAQPLQSERDLRARTHAGALSRFYLDAMLGLAPVRTHGAEASVRREHESRLVSWTLASRELVAVGIGADGISSALGYAFAAAIVTSHLARAGVSSGALLVLYWALALPTFARQVALAVRQYPALRNATLRLVEPLGAAEREAGNRPEGKKAGARHGKRGVKIDLEGVKVVAGGHVLLEDVSLRVPAGAHIAVVGPSGAGKSTLVGLLLGWHRAAEGSVRVDGAKLGGAALAALRVQTAWVDPGVQLWNRSLYDNVRYGSAEEPAAFASLVEAADLHAVLEHLPKGLATPLGEGGGLVSGGEGQRVRLARALAKSRARLAILDEPFRGLAREQRHAMLEKTRALFRGATLLCVTHDVEETRSFDRVLVVEGGRVIEDGAPGELAAREGSRYRALLDAERELERAIWGAPGWRHLYVERGRVTERFGRPRPQVEVPAGGREDYAPLGPLPPTRSA